MIIARRWVAQCLQNYRSESNTVRGTKQSGAHSKKFSLHSSWYYVAVADSCERDDLKVEQWVRRLCQRFGKFEPEIGALANSPESLISMVAAGRGVFVGPEIGIRGRSAAIGFYLLTEAESQFELFAIWKKQSQIIPTIFEFIDVLQASIKLSEVV